MEKGLSMTTVLEGRRFKSRGMGNELAVGMNMRGKSLLQGSINEVAKLSKTEHHS